MSGTQAGAKLYISAALIADAVMDQAAFEALSWVRVNDVGSLPDYGRNEAIATYNTLDNGILKGKGSNNAGDGDVELAYKSTDAGQVLMRTAGAGKSQWAFKIEFVDDDSGSPLQPTIDYLRAIVSGPRHPSGSDEDFMKEVYSLGIVQHLRDVQA